MARLALFLYAPGTEPASDVAAALCAAHEPRLLDVHVWSSQPRHETLRAIEVALEQRMWRAGGSRPSPAGMLGAALHVRGGPQDLASLAQSLGEQRDSPLAPELCCVIANGVRLGAGWDASARELGGDGGTLFTASAAARTAAAAHYLRGARISSGGLMRVEPVPFARSDLAPHVPARLPGTSLLFGGAPVLAAAAAALASVVLRSDGASALPRLSVALAAAARHARVPVAIVTQPLVSSHRGLHLPAQCRPLCSATRRWSGAPLTRAARLALTDGAGVREQLSKHSSLARR